MLACLCLPQFELSSVLTHEASGSRAQCRHTVDHGAIELLMHQLQSDDFDVADQAVQGVSRSATGGEASLEWMGSLLLITPFARPFLSL